MSSIAQELIASVTPTRLHLIVLPTEACNFRCVYCYESFRLKKMDPQVVRGIKKLLQIRAPALDRLTLSWFGGEPLLASDIVEDVLEHVARLRGEYSKLRLASDVTTNASLLTVPLLERLVALGADDYQVTFDGPRPFHDRKRVRPGGLPTFDVVWGRLADARGSKAPFRMQVRLHVDRENTSAISTFFDEYLETFGGDERYSLFIRGLSRLGGPRDSELRILEGDTRKSVIERLRTEAADRGIRLSNASSEGGVCYAARGNSFVIRADGRVNKCTVALEAPENQVGFLQPDGKLRLRAEAIRPWMRGFGPAGPDALACPMKGLVLGRQALAIRATTAAAPA